ncbi:MAG: DUF2062 domain-containing protein [Gammaproteobacteria bacterium]|nr:MAG: DUF2062 domain-containing protein [Gammaproteobacteria bacterium]
MPRKLIRRYLPHHDTIRGHSHLRWLGTLLHDPNLWHLNRRSVSGAVAVGLFCAFIPVPFQMVIAALLSMLLRVNLPVSVVLVWISNPLTMGPIFFFAYTVGTWIIGDPTPVVATDASILEWLTSEVKANWKPFLLGCFVCGSISALLGYTGARLTWRLHLVRRLHIRRGTRKPST